MWGGVFQYVTVALGLNRTPPPTKIKQSEHLTAARLKGKKLEHVIKTPQSNQLVMEASHAATDDREYAACYCCEYLTLVFIVCV